MARRRVRSMATKSIDGGSAGGEEYWLSLWLRSEGISTKEQGIKALSSRRARMRAIQIIDSTAIPWNSPIAATAPFISGTSTDLTGSMSCIHPSCLKREVDASIRRSWHFFDQIVVVGADPLLARIALERDKFDAAYEALAHHIETWLYIDSQGLGDTFIFRPRPHSCIHTIETNLHLSGLDSIISQKDNFMDQAIRLGVFQERPVWNGNEWSTTLRHESGIKDGIPLALGPDATEAELEKAAAAWLFHDVSDHLLSDLAAAEAYGAPLGVNYRQHVEWQPVASSGHTTSEVALELTFPYVDSVPTRELIRAKREHSDSFEKFRYALRKAMSERVNSGKDAKAAAAEVQEDIIQPALNDIEIKMKIAARNWRLKTTGDLAFGGASIVMGLLMGVPLVSAAGFAAGGLSLRHYHKYVEETSDIQNSDMYFLWRAGEAN